MMSGRTTISETDVKKALDLNSSGQEMFDLISKLYPICRSITGDGVRKTLEILQSYIPLKIHEVATGTRVFDWVVPKEWNIKDAYVKNSEGQKVVNFKDSNLHVVSYSLPIQKKVSFTELKNHLYTLPEHPDWIPHKTSYYKGIWGFCLSHKKYLQLQQDEEYEVYIDSSLEDGYLSYGEYFIPGETDDEVLFSCHTCHPSLCNDNLSGIALSAFLANYLSSVSRRYSYRFVFVPSTIGSITWLCLNETKTKHIKHGLVVSGVGDKGHMTYKKSRRGDAEIDRAAMHVLDHSGQEFEVKEFSPYGYDERQYCSPGFNLPVGSLTRTPFGTYPEYHTSADNLDFVKSDYLQDSFEKYLAIIDILENNRTYMNTNPNCEPQLGKRGLYASMGGRPTTSDDRIALLWALNQSDGNHTLLDIAEKSNINFPVLRKAVDALVENSLLVEL